MRKFPRTARHIATVGLMLCIILFFLTDESIIFFIVGIALLIFYFTVVIAFKLSYPVITVKAKIIKRHGIHLFRTTDIFMFLLPGGKKLELEFPYAGFYPTLKEGDFVFLKYSGDSIISMKKIKKAFSSPQVEKMKASFNKMTTAQKSIFIKNLKERLQDSKSVEFKEFLNECITQYNLDIKGSKSN